MWQRQLAWRAAGRVSVLRCGPGEQAWCMVLVPARGGWGGNTAPGRVA